VTLHTAWVIWHFRDERHFYYLTLKPNGWEIGKRDPSCPGGERFLISDKLPTYYFNTWYDVRIVQVGNTMAVWVNGYPLARFTGDRPPCTEGHVGLYAETPMLSSPTSGSSRPAGRCSMTRSMGPAPHCGPDDEFSSE
jgi:hypothetical protein